MKFLFLSIAVLGLLLLTTTAVLGKDVRSFPPHTIIPYSLESGKYTGADKSGLVFSEEISIADAHWIVLQFGEYNLGENSYVRIEFSQDGKNIKLTGAVLDLMEGWPIPFPASTVRLELHVAPDDNNVYFHINQVLAGLEPLIKYIKGECHNGCGPDGYICDELAEDECALFDQYFEADCNHHDNCYCYGAATYCEGRDYCDNRFCADMEITCMTQHPGSDECLALALTACGLVKLLGPLFYIDPQDQECNDYYHLCGPGEWCLGEVNPDVYVNSTYTGCPSYGQKCTPVTTVDEGLGIVSPGGTVTVRTGTYPENLTITKSLILKASGGTTIIGQ
jgi:hypothetical protein